MNQTIAYFFILYMRFYFVLKLLLVWIFITNWLFLLWIRIQSFWYNQRSHFKNSDTLHYLLVFLSCVLLGRNFTRSLPSQFEANLHYKTIKYNKKWEVDEWEFIAEMKTQMIVITQEIMESLQFSVLRVQNAEYKKAAYNQSFSE